MGAQKSPSFITQEDLCRRTKCCFPTGNLGNAIKRTRICQKYALYRACEKKNKKIRDQFALIGVFEHRDLVSSQNLMVDWGEGGYSWEVSDCANREWSEFCQVSNGTSGKVLIEACVALNIYFEI